MRAKAKFCGNPCKFAWQKRNPAKPRAPRLTQPCATCGEPVSYLPSQRGATLKTARSDNVYCSRKCKGVAHSKIMTGRRYVAEYTNVATFRSLMRARLIDRCAICGWDAAPNDVAHIVARKAGGTDDFENVVMLCPNHHRMFDRGLIPIEEVRAARVNCLSDAH